MEQKIRLAKNNFLNLKDHCDFETARCVVVPFGFESTTSYGQGTALGPKAIISASAEVELFDEKLWREPYADFGIATLKPFAVAKNQKKALAQLQETALKIVKAGKIPVVLGGEHSLSLAPLLALKQKYRDIAVLHFDAHSDLRPEYAGNPQSHASAMHMLLPHITQLISVGIRNFSADEIPILEKNKNKIQIHWAHDIREHGIEKTIKYIVPVLREKNVYLSFDVDAFDISQIGSSTGTPEPDGLSYREVIKCFETILPEVNLIGADFVELRPVKNAPAPDFLIAKTIYKTLSFAYCEN